MSWSEWDQNGGLEFVPALDDVAAQLKCIGDQLACAHRQLAGYELVGAAAEGAAAVEKQIAAITDGVKLFNAQAAAHHDRQTSRDYPFFGGW